MIDWNKNEEENKTQYKDYAPEGKYKTCLESVELITAKTGTKGIRLNLAETDDYKFPKYGAVAWVSMNKDSWRIHHFKELFVAIGLTEAQARKAVELCEEKDDKAEAYLDMLAKALPKQKEFEIEVFYEKADDQYPTWDFTSEKVRMTRPQKGQAKEQLPTEAEVAEDIDMNAIPF